MYTHKKGKGAGKYNGMARAADWEGKRVKAARDIMNNGGNAVKAGTLGIVTSAHRGLNLKFDVCQHCGTVLFVRAGDYFCVELAD